ncbi:hypothetical protein CLOM_g3431 [Closterium sp. NIES-68]|nr:hypothetical protein CLOM_g3431 [Closterium sp. NIES-68]
MSLSLSGTFSCDSSHFSYDPAPDDTGWESPSDCGADAVFGAQYGDPADGGAMGRDPFSTSSQPRKAKAGAPAAGKAHGTAAAAHSHQHADRAPSVCRHALVASRKPLVAGAAGNAVQGRVAAGGVKPRHRLADGKGAPGGGGRIPAQDAPDGGKGLRGHTAAGSGSVNGSY